MIGLKDKIAIVTGGGTGIGKACVIRLCQEGVSVTFSDKDEQKGVQAESEMIKMGFNVHFAKGDMAEESFCKRIVNETLFRFGGLHFLVNNAFSFISKGIDASKNDWDRVMQVGPMAYANMAKYGAPHMLDAGSGAIVNISSISAHIAQPNRWTYNAAKGAITALTKCMAMDLAPRIRVNAVSPAWTWTSETAKAANHDRGKWEPVWGRFHLLGRLADAEEIAAPVAFLLSEEASFITGTDLLVDGGYLTMGGEGLGENSNFVGSQ